MHLLDEIKYYRGWVDPPSFFISEVMRISTESRSRYGLLKGQHRMIKRLLLLEIIPRVLQLPVDVQEIICRKWNYRDFPYFYFEVASRGRANPYNIWEIWGTYFNYHYNGGLGGIVLPAHQDRDEEVLKAWKYGMCRALWGGWPTPESAIYKYFTKFQKEIFKKLASSVPFKFIDVTSANIEVENGKAKSAHYLIRIMSAAEPWVPDPITTLLPRIKDATEARAMGFFYIYEYIKKYQETDCLIFRVGFTTFIVSASFKLLLSQAIERSESIQEYIAQIEGGIYLSPRGYDLLIDNLIAWDKNFSENLMKDLGLKR